MEKLKRVHLRPLISGDFVIEGITYKGKHIEEKLDVQSVDLCLMMQFYIDIRLKTGREYRIWYYDMDMSRVSVPMYINKYKVRATYLHALYAIVAEVSYYLSGFSKEINRDYLMNTKEIYLELQRNLLDERERELLSNELVSRLLYDEHSKMIIERTKPDELIYEDKGTIFSMLRGVIPISKIMVKSLNDEQKTKQIQLTDFQVGSGGICKMLYFNNGIKVKEYIMKINKMTYSHLNLDIVLELNDIDSVDKEYVAYSETVRGFGNMYPKIYFSSDEKIIITKVK